MEDVPTLLEPVADRPELETDSIYDSLLRGVAAEPVERDPAPSIRINAEVGPAGKFVLQQEIGSGAMGRVYRALDRYLLRDVAIKFILRPEGMNHDDFMALFWQEAHIIARLDQHDNIVRILEVDRAHQPPFIVMEYLDGQSLEKLMRRDPIDLATIFHIMIAVACGLGEAHAKGVCHRDLKPSNIFVQKTRRVKLLDFGLARIRNHLFEHSTTRAKFTDVHAIPALANAGTPAYMAPEQWRGEDADAATDLWAMGAILYRLLAKAPPFEADSLAALSSRVLSGEPPQPLAERCTGVPLEVCGLVDRMLRFERAARPSQVAEVIAVLESARRRVASDPPLPATALGSAPRLPGQGSDPWSSSEQQPTAHGSSPGAVRHWDKALLVVVPGASSADRVAPDQLAGWILGHAGLDCEVLRCPPVDDGDVEDGAIRLRGYLNERLKRPRHIVFITHGDGTDVALRMLLDEAHRLHPDGAAIELDSRSPFYRTRQLAILRPGRGVTTAHHVAGQRAGRDGSPLVAELVAGSQPFIAANLPAPAIHYFGIDDDRGPLHAESATVKALAQMIARPEMMVVRETFAQTFELDCAARISTLVAPADAISEDAAPTVPGAEAASQAEIFDELVALARTQRQRPTSLVIAGDAGVGKSAVLRMVVRRLCGELTIDAGAVLPVLVPAYFANLSAEQLAVLDAEPDDRRGRVLLDLLLGWWCDWFNATTYRDAVTLDWVKARLRTEPVMLIFDGVDELITNHPSRSMADFQQLVAHVGAEYRQNGWLTLVFGVRSSQPGLPLLGSGNIREVLRLTPGQAARQFPAASSWLGKGGVAAPIHKLLLTPLILAQLNTRRAPSSQRPTTDGEVLTLALTTIIEQSDLCGKLDERGQPIDAQRWIDALMAAAWCMFRRLRGDLALSTLKADAAELHRAWSDHLAATGQQAQGDRLLAGFHLLCESRAFDALLHRTILYPSGRGEARFIHREWQDFLAARYLAQVVMYRYVDELRHVGNTARIAGMAGELLCQAGVRIDEPLVVALLDRANDSTTRLVTANFAALVTNSRVLIDGSAIDVFLAAVSGLSPVVRCIILTGLGYRALRSDDASAHDLRHRLIRVFRDYRARPDVDPELMRSLAWCYCKAYAQRFGGPPVTDPWPGLGDSAERSALAMMCAPPAADHGEGPRILAEHRSIQTALLEVQHAVAGNSARPISGVHYLYCLVVARRHGGGIAELGRELPALLDPASAYAQAIEHDPLVPELRQIMARCRELDQLV
jgi:serine/threonine protein kinase